MIGLGLSITQLAVRQMLGGPVAYDPIQDFANGEQGFIYDISDLSTLFQDVAGTIPAVVGLSVARINDKSGNGNYAIQVTPTSRAILRFVDGKYWIQTDGTDDWYITPTITPGSNKAQVFSGIRKLSDAARGILLEQSALATDFQKLIIEAPQNSTNKYRAVLVGDLQTNPEYVYTDAGMSAPHTAVLGAIFDRSLIDGSVKLMVNGELTGVFSSPYSFANGFGNYPFYLFRRGGTSLPFNGMISSMVLRFGPNLTPEQIANMNAWTNERAGAY